MTFKTGSHMPAVCLRYACGMPAVCLRYACGMPTLSLLTTVNAYILL